MTPRSPDSLLLRAFIDFARRQPASVVLLALCAFLIPLIGGQIALEPQPLEPGYSPTVRALFHGVEVPGLQHALLAFLVLGSLGYLLIRRKILQVPNAWVTGPLAAFFAFLILSVFMSEYRWTSVSSLAEWCVYGLAVPAVVGGLGRKRGPTVVLEALSAGCGLTALLGILEFAAAHNPTWRIFGGWNNPNALAGMMAIGALIGLGLLSRAKSTGSAVFAGLSATLCVIAIFLTGSKGGVFVSLGIGLSVLILLSTLWNSSRGAAALGMAVGLSVLSMLAIVGFAVLGKGTLIWAVGAGLGAQFLVAAAAGQRGAVLRWLPVLIVSAIAIVGVQRAAVGAGAEGLRVGSGAATQEQSAGFRIQLWTGALALIKEDPMGRGLDTYADYSSMPGTNTRTELAHSTWLQLGAEAGLAPFALLLAIFAWLFLSFRSARSLPADLNAIRASVVAAVAAIVVDGLIESNLYYFGIGLTLFLLIGIGVQLSADAAAPEFVAPPIRFGTVGLSALCLAVLLLAGVVGLLQDNLLWLGTNQRVADARDTASTLRSIAPFDGETWYRSGWLATNLDEAVRDYEQAASVAPTPKYLRRLAFVQVEAGHPQQAEESLRKALHYDPMNLEALYQLMQLQDKEGNQAGAQDTARRLIAVEKSPYFQIRSIAEIVPTQTYDARLFLAKTAPDRTDLLKGAVEGYLDFSRTTAPYVRAMIKGGLPSVGGLTGEDVDRKLQNGVDAAHQLASAARDRETAGWAAAAAEELSKSLAGS